MKDPLTGLRSFAADCPEVPRYLLGPDPRPRVLDGGVHVLALDGFLREVLPGP